MSKSAEGVTNSKDPAPLCLSKHLGHMRDLIVAVPNEPYYEKTDLLHVLPSEESNEPAHPRSRISLPCPHEENWDH